MRRTLEPEDREIGNKETSSGRVVLTARMNSRQLAQELAHHRVIMHGEGNHDPPSPSEAQALTINGCWGKEYHFVQWYSHRRVALVQANHLLPTLN